MIMLANGYRVVINPLSRMLIFSPLGWTVAIMRAVYRAASMDDYTMPFLKRGPYVRRLLRVLGCAVSLRYPHFGRSIESVSLLSLPVNLNGTW